MSDGFFKGWFIFCALLSLALTGVTVWAVVSLVQWLVSR